MTSVRDECEASFEDGIVQVLYQRAPDIPYESPLSFRQVEKTNVEVKRAQEEDISGRGKYNEYTPEHRLEGLPLNMDPQRQSDISQSFCPVSLAFYTQLSLHISTSTPRSNVQTGQGVRVTYTSRDNYI